MATKKATPKKSAPKKATTSSSPYKQERKWEIESALETLKRAESIKKDQKLMSDVKKLAQEQVGMLKNLTSNGKG
jgi:hypothetical protein